MKKFLCCILAFLMCTGALISCSENKEISNTENSNNVSGETEAAIAESETEDLYGGLVPPAVEDMDGAEMTIMNWTGGWTMWTMFAEEMNGEVLNDALYEREMIVEEKYNASLAGVISETDSTQDLTVNSRAGDHLFDVTVVFDANLMDVFDYIRPWEILDIDYSQPWWDQGSVEQFNLWGVQAALTGAFALQSYSTRHCYAFNEDILDRIQPGLNIYDEVREGKWTVDRMYELGELATFDYDNDGMATLGTDYVGISGAVRRHYNALIGGAGVRYVDRNEENDLVFAIVGDNYALNVLDKLATLNESVYVFQSGSNIVWGLADAFPANRVLFQASYAHEIYNKRELEFNIGVLPPPKYEEYQEQYYSIVEGGGLCVLPITLKGDDVEKTEILLEAFTFYSYVKSLDAYIETVLLNKIARSKDSSEMLRICFDNSFYDMGAGFLTTSFSDTFHMQIFMSKRNVVSSTIASVSQSSTKMLNRLKKNLQKNLLADK